MKIVKEHINERLGFTEDGDPIKDMGIGRPKRSDVVVDHYFEYIVNHIKKYVYPHMENNKDDIYALNVMLRDWLNNKL